MQEKENRLQVESIDMIKAHWQILLIPRNENLNLWISVPARINYGQKL